MIHGGFETTVTPIVRFVKVPAHICSLQAIYGVQVFFTISAIENANTDLLDTEISAAITAGNRAVNYRRDAGQAIATMCTALD